jgi:hypothetical protein
MMLNKNIKVMKDPITIPKLLKNTPVTLPDLGLPNIAASIRMIIGPTMIKNRLKPIPSPVGN